MHTRIWYYWWHYLGLLSLIWCNLYGHLGTLGLARAFSEVYSTPLCFSAKFGCFSHSFPLTNCVVQPPFMSLSGTSVSFSLWYLLLSSNFFCHLQSSSNSLHLAKHQVKDWSSTCILLLKANLLQIQVGQCSGAFLYEASSEGERTPPLHPTEALQL